MGVVLVVIGVLASAVTAYVYFRIIVLMYFTQAPEDDVVALTPSVATTIVVTVGVLATLLLGIVRACCPAGPGRLHLPPVSVSQVVAPGSPERVSGHRRCWRCPSVRGTEGRPSRRVWPQSMRCWRSGSTTPPFIAQASGHLAAAG